MTDIEIDAGTGLPALPDGLFWRVEPLYLFRNFQGYYTTIRAKRRFGSSLEWEGKWVDPNSFAAHEQAIRWLAMQTYADWREYNLKGRVQENLLGDYPPNTLKTEEKND